MPVDFEALDDLVDGANTTDTPSTKTGNFDFEAFDDATSHAAGLATHRWRLNRLQTAERTNTIPTPQGLAPLNKLTSGPQRPQTDSVMKYLGHELTPGASLTDNAVKDVAGLGLGILDMGQLALRGAVNPYPQQREELAGMVKDTAEFSARAPLATMGAILSDQHPAINEFLKQYGVSRDDFNTMFHNNPVGTLLAVLGPAEGRGASKVATDKVMREGQLKNIEAVDARTTMETLARQQNDPGPGPSPEQANMNLSAQMRAAQEATLRDQGLSPETRATNEAVRTGRANIENEWRDRVANLNEQQRGMREAASVSEQTRQDTLINQSGGRIVNEKGKPKYIGGEAIPEGVVGQEQAHNKAQFMSDLNQGAAEGSPPSLPSEGFQAWSMEKGFDAAPETLTWMNNRELNRGFDLTASEIDIRAKRASEAIATVKKTRRKKKGKFGNERGGIDPQVFQDVYDLAAHFAKKAKSYGEWAGQMVKHVGQIGAELLAKLWEQVKSVLSYESIKPPVEDLIGDYKARYPKGYLEDMRGTPEYEAQRTKLRQSLGMERRGGGEERAAVTGAIDEFRKAGLDHIQAIEAINKQKALGEITGPQESALLREASKTYSNTVLGPPEPYMPTGGKDSPFSFGALNDEPKGPTLGALGGQELYDRTVNAAIKVGKILAKESATFEDWASKLKNEASRHGVKITDEQIRKAWDSPDLAAMRPPETDRWVGTKAAEAVAAGTEDSNAKRWGGEDAFNNLRDGASRMWGGAKGSDWANVTVNTLRDIWNSDLGTAPGFTRIKTYIPQMYETLVRYITSKMDAFMRTRNHFNELDSILGKDKKLRNSFSDLINDDRARGLEQSAQDRAMLRDTLMQQQLEAQKANDTKAWKRIEALIEELDEVPEGHNVPKLSDTERAILLANPKIEAAIKYWTEKMTPEIEGLSTDLGIARRFQGPLGLYARMKWVNAFEEVAHNFRDRELGRPQGGLGSSSPLDVRPKSPGSQKTATGRGPQGSVPENSLFHIIHNTYERRIVAKNLEALRQSVRDAAVAKSSDLKGKHVDPFTSVGGRQEAVVPQILERAGGLTEDIYHVPSMVADAFKQATGARHIDAVWKVFDKINDAATVQVILMPAEAVNHGFNVIQVMTTVGKAKGWWSTPEAALAAATLGGSRIANAMYKSFNLHGPEFATLLRDMAEGGALRMRGYKGFDTMQQGFLMRAAEKTPGLHQLKDSVFGDPGTTRGIGGMETRLRAVLWNLAKEDNPTLTNAELGRFVNNAMGTYVSKMEAPLARLLKGVDPFIRAGATLTKVGFRSAIGKDALGRFSPNNLLAVYGTLVAAQYYSKLLDDQGRWPWQIPGWKPTYLFYMDRGDKRVSFGLSSIANPVARAANFSGARALIESAHKGNTKPSDLFMDWKRGVTNAIFSRPGPFSKAMSVATLNKVPYVLPDNNFMPAVTPSMAGSQVSPVAEWAKAVGSQVIPLPTKISGAIKEAGGFEGLPEGKEILPDEHIARVIFKLNDIFKVPYFPTLHQQTDIKKPYAQYRTQNQYDDTVNDIVRRAKNVPPEQLDAFIQQEMSRLTEDLVMVGGKPVPANIGGLIQVYQRLGRAPASAAKGMAIQQTNAQGQ